MEPELNENSRQLLALLELKMNAPEVRQIPRLEALDRYLVEESEAVRQAIATLSPEEKPDWAPLNALFLETVLTTS